MPIAKQISTSLQKHPVLLLSVAASPSDFDRYPLKHLTDPDRLDFPLWKSSQGFTHKTLCYANAIRSRDLPDPTDYAGILVGGSIYSVYERFPWQKTVKGYLANAYEKQCWCHRSLQNQPVGVESKPATLR